MIARNIVKTMARWINGRSLLCMKGPRKSGAGAGMICYRLATPVDRVHDLSL